MTSQIPPNTPAQARQLNAYTVDVIVLMIDSRRARLDAQWLKLERGSAESAENLAAESALADLKWAVLDELEGRTPPEA
jgi:hypothetical protein